MDIRFDHQIPPAPEGGREYLQWHAEKRPIWAMTNIDGWTCAIRIAQRDDKLLAAEMRLYPMGGAEDFSWSGEIEVVPGNGLTASMVRKIRLGEFIGEAITRITEPGHDRQGDIEDWYDMVTLGGIDPGQFTEKTTRSRRGRPPLSDEFLAWVALLYARAIESGDPSPVKTVTEQLDDPEPRRVAQVIQKARDRGFLTPAPAKGIAGGELTEKAVEVLRAMKTTDPQRETR